MLVKKENKNLISRLRNYKFNSAIEYLDGEDERVKIIIMALADTFGDIGWFGGSMSEIVDAVVVLLIGGK